MTNPNNAIGTNAAYSGRTSPNAFNDITASFTAGIVSGWECVPKTGMTVQVGGQAGTRDVALAEDNAGNKLTINNRSGAPVEVTLSGAPSTNNRVDAIVAYVDNPSTGDNTTTDNPTTCGIIAVSGTVAANPTAPSEATIRSAITTDGATGGTAYYIVLATIYVGTNVTTIGSGVITAGTIAQTSALADGSVTTSKLADGAVTTDKLGSASVTSGKVDWTTMPGSYSTTEQQTPFTWINGKPVYKKTVDTGALPNNASKQIQHGISNLDIVVSLSGFAKGGTTQITLPYVDTNANASVGAYVSGEYVRIFTSSNRSDFTTSHVTLYYTKTTD